MRVVVVGGGSMSTPHLARHLAQRTDIGSISIVLAGRNVEQVAAVARASRLLAGGSPVRIEEAEARDGDWRACLAGADLVLVQARVGGYEARRYDETFPLEFDLCGDEGLGPGGLAAGWRTWPVLSGILNDVRAACPSAEVVLLTSPVSLLVRLARAKYPDGKVAGICELPFTTLRGIARRMGVGWDQLEWDYLGINHIGWLYGVGPREETVPLKYLRLEDRETLVEQKTSPGGRAEELARLKKQVLEAYAHGGREEIERALSLRTADWYDDAAGPLIASRAGAAERMPFFLSAAQGAWNPAFAPDDILEIPHAGGPDGIARAARRPAPERLSSRLLRFVEYERAAAQAVRTRDRASIAECLRLHPWIPATVPAEALAARICA